MIFPLTISADADITLSNTNNRLQTSNLSGNWVLGARLAMTYTKNANGIPSLGLNINPNDVINNVDKQQFRLQELIKTIKIDPEGNINLVDIRKTLTEDKKKLTKESDSPAKKSGLIEIDIMESFLKDMEKVINDSKMTPVAKQACLKENLQAFESQYKATVLQGLDGHHLA